MLEPKFVPPDPNTAHQETRKRNELIEWFSDYIRGAVTGLLVTGSMAYGQDYSVTPTSDIDLQLLITPESAGRLLQIGCFDAATLSRAVEGYRKGIYKQFSLVFERNGITMECHFWDEQAFIAAITFVAQNTKRLRSSIDSPSRDYAYAFDRDEDIADYYGDSVDGFAVADFHSYRMADGKLFLCRPITNILGVPLIKISNQQLGAAIDQCWQQAVERLADFAGGLDVDLDRLSILNTLPGKNKMSPEAMQRVQARTRQLLQAL